MKKFRFHDYVLPVLLLAVFWSCNPGDRPKTGTSFSTFSEETGINPWYEGNRPPLLQKKFIRLPLGSIKPEGWLRDQLIVQKNGLTGHLDEFWLTNSIWKGGDSEKSDQQLPGSWSRGAKFMTKYIAGLVALAYTLDDPQLRKKAGLYVNWILDSRQSDGWFGIDRDFPAPGVNANSILEFNSVVLMMLIEYYDVSHDERIIPLMEGYFNYLRNHYTSFPQQVHWGIRIKEHLVSAIWLYNKTGDPMLLDLMDNMHDKSFNWSLHFTYFPWHDPDKMKIPNNFYWDGESAQIYNIARAIKYPALWYSRTGDPFYRDALYAALENLDRYHGQVGGRFSGDEHVSGKPPTQGSELCSIALLMYSLEKSIEILGDPVLADRLEMLAYNCIPATISSDFWSHQYDQQSNQVLVSVDDRPWSSNRPTSNIFGLMPNFPCCLVGMHMPWPRFVEHMWMASRDRGVAAITYGPTKVSVKVGNGEEVILEEETEYPFDRYIRIKVSLASPVSFPVYLRIPVWTTRAELTVEGESQIVEGGGRMVRIEREWSDGDEIRLNLPMHIRTETRFNHSTSILRGPLYYALRIGKEYKRISLNGLTNGLSIAYKGSVDWEIRPTTPWNYGLIFDPSDPENSITVRRNPVSPLPFSDLEEQVYDAESDTYQEWMDPAPVVLTIHGKRIPEWKMKNHSADDPPLSPVVSQEPVEVLELVPYGCTRLRITEFPTILEN
jgi:hypothetical protein